MSIARECHIPGFEDPDEDVLVLVKQWLEGKKTHRWLLVVDNADDKPIPYLPDQHRDGHPPVQESGLARLIP